MTQQLTPEQIQKLVAKDAKSREYHRKYVAKRKAKDPDFLKDKTSMSLTTAQHEIIKEFADKHNLSLAKAVIKAITEYRGA